MRKYLTIVIGIIFLIIFGGCQTLPKPNFAPEGKSLKFVTYNVNMQGHAPRVTEFLQKIDADIICLQETHGQWESFLREHLTGQYPHMSFHNTAGGGGISILSKHPQSEQQVIRSEAGWFPALYAKVSTPIGEIGVLIVHLKPPVSDKGSVTAYAILKSPETHLGEMKEFFDKLESKAPLIVAGDFNEDESGKACQWLIGRGYIESLSLFDRKSHTWIWRTKPGIVLKNRYDHIFVNQQFQCTGAGVFQVKASDHEPVLSVLQ